MRHWFDRIAVTSFVFGLILIGFLIGAASAYFEWNAFAVVGRIFSGGEALYHKQLDPKLESPSLDIRWPGYPKALVNRAVEVVHGSDGFVLLAATQANQVNRALLIEMQGKVRQAWRVDFATLWPKAPHIAAPSPTVFVGGMHVYPNRNLLVSFMGFGDTPYGYGLALLDKHSRPIWKVDKNIHHMFDVSRDGTIVALSQEIKRLDASVNRRFSAILSDSIDILTPDGTLDRSIDIQAAFADTQFWHYLQDFPTDHSAPWDISHANSVTVLDETIAPHFPMFPAGSLLVSIRNSSTIAVIDPSTEKVVWATRGPWRNQHSASFLGNGNILLFDNLGGYHDGVVYSRVLEYNPRSNAVEWSYGDTPPYFLSPVRGQTQRLANGNTLIVDAYGLAIFEVTPNGAVAWKYEWKHSPRLFSDGAPVTLRKSGIQSPGDLMKIVKDNNQMRFARWYEPHEVEFIQ